MIKPLLTASLTLALVACGNTDSNHNTNNSDAANNQAQAVSQEAVKSQTEKINEWFEDQYEQELLMSPIGLTFQGRKERYGEIDDMSEAAEAEQLAWKKKSVETMKATFDYNQLSDDAKISYDLWAYQYERAAAGEQFNRRGYVFHQMLSLIHI